MKHLEKDLKENSDKEKAKILQGFFKTGKGEYGEGDIFLGITVPKQREIAKKHTDRFNSKKIIQLLNTKIHEKRLIALLMLIEKYKKTNDEKMKEKIFNFYLKNSKNVNNWDLVDLSAPNIVGDFLLEKPRKRKILYKLAKSQNLWERRISILATFTFIKNNDFSDSLKIAEILLKDKHDLIHKAVGWMLRELGKRNQEKEEVFLKKYYKDMPRTMLRYSIERFPEKKRKAYLLGDI
jgi:3-methyladenine DNA glycosylase AlkD